MNPNTPPLYAGIAGVSLPIDQIDFGEGITLKKTYAHIMAPYLAAFAPAKSGMPHPGPWKSVSGGLGFDIEAELYVPPGFSLPSWFDRVNTIWWFVALIRLKASNLATVPVVADKSFAEIPLSKDEPCFWPIEMKPSRLVLVNTPSKTLNESDLRWIHHHWLAGGKLMNENDDFNLALQAIDQIIWSHSPSLALVSLWGALERLFSPSHVELSFRVSATIASYLELPGENRLDCYRRVKKLYDARSKAAHGSTVDESKSLMETYDILKRSLIKMIEEEHVPTREQLEKFLFGAR